MYKLYEINYLDIEEDALYENIINKVLQQCFEVENMLDSKLYINIILTTPSHIRDFNKQYRNIDKETDVLSFPIFEKDEIKEKIKNKDFANIDILGDMVISIEKVKEQAEEYGHSFERELAYMVVHSFYHLMGYDHIKEEDKSIMRQKEENILEKINLSR